MKFKSVIFDMDGTLVDTEALAAATVLEILTEMGMTFAKEDAQAVVGRTWESAIKILENRLFPRFSNPNGESPAEWSERLLQQSLSRYRKQLKEGLQSGALTIPGVVEKIFELDSAKIPMALVSGSHRAEVEEVLSALGVRRCFRVVYGAEDYQESKPSPEGFLKAARALGVLPQETLVFEDSRAGIQAGKMAGMHVIAVQCANHFHQDQSQADGRISDFQSWSFSGTDAGFESVIQSSAPG